MANAGKNSRPDDGYVHAQQFGATQFAKTGAAYVASVAESTHSVLELLENVSNQEADHIFLTQSLEQSLLKRGMHFGPAKYKGYGAGSATFRQWLDNGKMSLMPHEDVAQLAFARRDGFEIGLVKTVLAYNACLKAPEEGGTLSVWDLEPNEQDREAFNVKEDGYPYPLEHLKDIERFSVELTSGDAYFLNAGFLHGVETVAKGERITAGRFMGLASPGKVVYWT